MNIAVIGAGNVGSGLARALVKAGHRVTVSASSPDSPRLKEIAAQADVTPADTLAAVRGAEVVVVAVPFGAVSEILAGEVAAAAAGKVVIDVTNPLTPDFMALTVGFSTSAGETVAARLPGARVVKAFNTIFAQHLGTPVVNGARLLLPVAGDDAEAKAVVLELGGQLGFDAVDAGPLANARYLEPTIELLIQLAYGQGLGPVGLSLTRG